MSLFRGSKNATIKQGDIVATQSDIAEAVNEALASKNAAETAETGAQTAESGAVDAQSYAEEWAVKPEDTLVSSDAGGNGVDEFSALHHAAKSSASASAAATSESNASASETAAANSASAAATSETNAAQSATNAATSESNAATSASEALTSEQNAATSETNAADSEAAAATSETNAANSATAAQSAEAGAEDAESYAQEWANAPEDTLISSAAGGDGVDDFSSLHHANKSSASASAAATSESNAASSASAAATSESNAATSESNAATSASNAATSETNAANSASAAATSETNAAQSETNAASSASAAATSESNAATSATNASDSASAAATSETNAASSASSAATSETNASDSASAAATSESNAQTSAQNAADTFDDFDDRYLGAKTSDPATDNDGNTLLTGALYWNSTLNRLNVWNGSSWDQAAFNVENAVTSFNTRTGDILLQSTDVTNALGYTPQDQSTAYDSADFSTDLGAETTDSLTEGGSNLYYTDARVRGAVSASGSLGYNPQTGVFSYTERTNSEIRNLFAASGDLTYDAATGTFSVTVPAEYDSADFDADFNSKSTSDLSEGTNLYYTDSRVDAHLSGGTGVSYSNGSISIGQPVGTNDNVTFEAVTANNFNDGIYLYADTYPDIESAINAAVDSAKILRLTPGETYPLSQAYTKTLDANDALLIEGNGAVIDATVSGDFALTFEMDGTPSNEVPIHVKDLVINNSNGSGLKFAATSGNSADPISVGLIENISTRTGGSGDFFRVDNFSNLTFDRCRFESLSSGLDRRFNIVVVATSGHTLKNVWVQNSTFSITDVSPASPMFTIASGSGADLQFCGYLNCRFLNANNKIEAASGGFLRNVTVNDCYFTGSSGEFGVKIGVFAGAGQSNSLSNVVFDKCEFDSINNTALNIFSGQTGDTVNNVRVTNNAFRFISGGSYAIIMDGLLTGYFTDNDLRGITTLSAALFLSDKVSTNKSARYIVSNNIADARFVTSPSNWIEGADSQAIMHTNNIHGGEWLKTFTNVDGLLDTDNI